MTGTLTLKRRFLEENAGSANFGSQKLQFFEKTLRTFENFDRLLPYLNKLPPPETNFSIVPVSGEILSTKNLPLLELGFCNQNSYNFWPIR